MKINKKIKTPDDYVKLSNKYFEMSQNPKSYTAEGLAVAQKHAQKAQYYEDMYYKLKKKGK